MQSFADLLKLWPTLQRISDELRVPYDTIAAWKHRNSIPYEYWPALEASALQNGIKGVSMESLADAAELVRRHRRIERAERRGQPLPPPAPPPQKKGKPKRAKRAAKPKKSRRASAIKQGLKPSLRHREPANPAP